MPARSLPLVLLLVLPLALAGCSGDAPADGDVPEPRAAPPPAAAPRFEDAVRVAAATSAARESFVATSADGGTLLTCQHGWFQRPPPMYASEDGGASWKELPPPPTAGVGGDCEVALAADGSWHFVASTVVGATVLSTDDRGATWTVAHLTALPLNGLADRPWLEAIGDDLLVMAYMPTQQQHGAIGVVRSTDGGATWDLPQVIALPEPPHTRVMHGHPHVAPDGAIRIALQRGPPQLDSLAPRTLSFAVSRDGAATWTEEVVLRDEPMFRTLPVATAVAGDGTLYWAYNRLAGDVEEMVCITSRDGGRTWDEPRVVAAGWRPFWFNVAIYTSAGIPWMSGRPDGSADLAWISDAEPVDASRSGTHLFVARLDADAPELVRQTTAVAPAHHVEFFQVANDDAGRAHIALRRDAELLYFGETPAARASL